MKIIFFLHLLLFTQCSFLDNRPPLKTVEKVDLRRFMGTWFVIANIPTFVEKDAHNAIETYTWNEKEKRVDIDFRFNAGAFDGALKKYPQKGFIYNKESNAEWRIRPIWPLSFTYLVIDLAADYSYTVIGVPDREHVWVMARSPNLEANTLQMIKSKLKNQGFDTSKLEMVPQEY